MPFILGARSQRNLVGVHPDLVRLVRRAIQLTDIDFTVIEGVRTVARQRELVAAGASRTMNSRHLTGHAVDLAPLIAGKVRWDWPLFSKLAAAMKHAGSDLAVPIRWGGDWKTFKDGPHFELPRAGYPAD
jgi:peptidoglycan L-alanyl-D-glutamate endopeptidase CwlK